jgi:hypothetical protein
MYKIRYLGADNFYHVVTSKTALGAMRALPARPMPLVVAATFETPLSIIHGEIWRYGNRAQFFTAGQLASVGRGAR